MWNDAESALQQELAAKDRQSWARRQHVNRAAFAVLVHACLVLPACASLDLSAWTPEGRKHAAQLWMREYGIRVHNDAEPLPGVADGARTIYLMLNRQLVQISTDAKDAWRVLPWEVDGHQISPDGTYILAWENDYGDIRAWRRKNDRGDTRAWRLYGVRSSGPREARLLAEGGGVLCDVEFSPDGQHVLLATEQEYCVYNRKTGGRQRLPVRGWGFERALVKWCADGKAVAIPDFDEKPLEWVIRRVEVDTGETRELMRLPARRDVRGQLIDPLYPRAAAALFHFNQTPPWRDLKEEKRERIAGKNPQTGEVLRVIDHERIVNDDMTFVAKHRLKLQFRLFVWSDEPHFTHTYDIMKGPYWLLDGRHFVYETDPLLLWIGDRETGDCRVLTKGREPDWYDPLLYARGVEAHPLVE